MGQKTEGQSYWTNGVNERVYSDLLQTEDERLGTLNLVNLPSLTHSLLDDVTIIIVILQRKDDY